MSRILLIPILCMGSMGVSTVIQQSTIHKKDQMIQLLREQMNERELKFQETLSLSTHTIQSQSDTIDNLLITICIVSGPYDNKKCQEKADASRARMAEETK